jgi:hypothetical protein
LPFTASIARRASDAIETALRTSAGLAWSEESDASLASMAAAAAPVRIEAVPMPSSGDETEGKLNDTFPAS